MTRELAHHHSAGAAPTIIFLPGYASDMSGTKVLAVEAWARAHGRAFLRFDYAGCGESPGAFEDYTLADWRDDAVAMIDRVEGPVVLVGSSMGGWIMLHAALARPERVTALLGIAAAPDFTDWGFTPHEKQTLLDESRLERPSPYSDQPTVFTRAFWSAGETMKLLGREIPLDLPVRLLQGQRDDDVPWEYAIQLAETLRSRDVQVTLIKDGDHRLSRDEDIALLLVTLESLLS